jgi:hypothetical protein
MSWILSREVATDDSRDFWDGVDGLGIDRVLVNTWELLVAFSNSFEHGEKRYLLAIADRYTQNTSEGNVAMVKKLSVD